MLRVSSRAENAQVLLRWATQRGIAVIPKSNSIDRLVANLQCDGFDLTDGEIDRISALNINYRVSTILLGLWWTHTFLHSSTILRKLTLNWLFLLEEASSGMVILYVVVYTQPRNAVRSSQHVGV